jgi:monoamine oxidase
MTINRRQVLATIATGTAASFVPRLSRAATKKRVIIAGGGISGLSCGYELTKRGHDVTVLEAAERAGGHVRTMRDGLPDGLYVDAGAEQFTKPGYDLYWSFVREFNLPYVQDHRRENMLRWIDGKMRTEDDLARPAFLSKLGFNQREIDFLKANPWWDLPRLYFQKYSDAFSDEYQPFGVGLDELDTISLNALLSRDGASAACIRYHGGNGSALHAVWHGSVLKHRGVPLWPTQVFRLVGGNSVLPDTFARHLGSRVKLNSPVRAIQHGDSGVTVEYGNPSQPQKISGDYLVCCMSAVMLRRIPITPQLTEQKRWAVGNVPYYSATRPVLLADTKFWRDQKQSINVEFYQPALEHVWSMADDVDSKHGLIVGTAQPGVPAAKPLEAFRKYYPGKGDTITKPMIIDWSRDPWAMACETTSYKPGELRRFWPSLIQPEKRIHFAGAYCDNLNWGQEAATRSGVRAAKLIDAA